MLYQKYEIKKMVYCKSKYRVQHIKKKKFLQKCDYTYFISKFINIPLSFTCFLDCCVIKTKMTL